MEQLKFMTPTECLLKKIKDNSQLNFICNEINNALVNEFSINEYVTVIVTVEKEINYEELFSLRDIYKRYNWKLVNSYSRKTSDNQMEYKFILSEAN